MSYPRKSAVDPSGYSTSAASWGWSTATTMWPHDASSWSRLEFCSFMPVKECEKSTSGKPSVMPSSEDDAKGGSATGTSTRASIRTSLK